MHYIQCKITIASFSNIKPFAKVIHKVDLKSKNEIINEPYVIKLKYIF